MHVVIALKGSLRFRAGARWETGVGVITPPDVRHEIDARGREVLLVFVDPESRAGSVLDSALGGRVRALTPSERAAIGADVDPLALMRGGAERWLDGLVAA